MRLLISVVNVQEAEEAVQGGAEIIDIKSPGEGSLRAQAPGKIREIVSAVPPGVETSATIGDVPNLPGVAALAAAEAAQCGVHYVKVGLFQVRRATDAMKLLAEVRLSVRACNPTARVIACTYADTIAGSCILPAELPGVAAAAQVDGCMVDTSRKDGTSLRSWIGSGELQSFIFACRQASLLSVLAGSLQGVDFEWVRGLAPDIVGVRSAACTGDRITGRVSRDRVARIRETLCGGLDPPDLGSQDLGAD